MLNFCGELPDTNFRFNDLVTLLEHLEFHKRVKGSHHIFTMEGVEDIINIQPLSDGKAKRYQVKQIRELIVKYGLGGTDD